MNVVKSFWLIAMAALVCAALSGCGGGGGVAPRPGRIVFDSGRDGNWEIYVMNADGSGQTRLTNNTAPDWKPCFSTDGSKIAFSSIRGGNEEIYVMNADGSAQTRLTNNPANDDVPNWGP